MWSPAPECFRNTCQEFDVNTTRQHSHINLVALVVCVCVCVKVSITISSLDRMKTSKLFRQNTRQGAKIGLTINDAHCFSPAPSALLSVHALTCAQTIRGKTLYLLRSTGMLGFSYDNGDLGKYQPCSKHRLDFIHRPKSHIVLVLIEAHTATSVVDERLKPPSIKRPTPRQEFEQRHSQGPVIDRLWRQRQQR